MPNLGVPELVVIFLILVIIFGARKLPELGTGLSAAITNFKKGLQAGQSSDSPDSEKNGAS